MLGVSKPTTPRLYGALGTILPLCLCEALPRDRLRLMVQPEVSPCSHHIYNQALVRFSYAHTAKCTRSLACNYSVPPMFKMCVDVYLYHLTTFILCNRLPSACWTLTIDLSTRPPMPTWLQLTSFPPVETNLCHRLNSWSTPRASTPPTLPSSKYGFDQSPLP